MKRFWIILLAAAMALVIALPAGAGKPCCGDDEQCEFLGLVPTPDHPTCLADQTTTTTLPAPDDVDCAFTGAGVLTNSDGEEIKLGVDNTSYRCKLIAAPSDSFEFTIGTVDGATALLQPMIAITDAYPSGDMCFRQFEVGRMTAVASTGVFPEVFVTFSMQRVLDSDADGECDFAGTTFVSDERSDVYTLTFQTGKAKGGTVQLEMTDANGEAPIQ